MGYLKGGIVTRIDVLDSCGCDRVSGLFDLELFDFNCDVYMLKESVLMDNFWTFHDEYMKMTEGVGDSIKNCEASFFDIDIHKLKFKKVLLSDDNKKFYFSDFVKKFDTEVVYFFGLRIYFISIYWNINKIQCEDFSDISLFVNNLTHNSLENKLKGASWISIL